MKMEVSSHVMLHMMIGYLLHITFEKYWLCDFFSKRGVARTLEATVANIIDVYQISMFSKMSWMFSKYRQFLANIIDV